MLQTIIVLVIFFILFILGGWMTFFGHRAFRFCGTLFGFALGVGGVLFGAWNLGFAFDSMPVVIATPLAGLTFGLLGAFVPIVGVGLGGLCFGFFYGVGIVYCTDTLLGGAIAPVLYTGISILLVVVALVLCLIFRDAAKWLTTALCGSYVASFALTLALMWFLAGGFQSTNTALSGSFVLQLTAIYGMISSTTKIFMLLFALFFGVLGCVLQAYASIRQTDSEPAMLDFSSATDEYPLALDKEEPLFDEDSMRKSTRKKRKSNRELDLEEDTDALDIFAAKKARLNAGATESALENKPGIASSASRVDTVEQISDQSEMDKASTECTRVFRRIKQQTPSADAKEPVAQQQSGDSVKRQASPGRQRPPLTPAAKSAPLAFSDEADSTIRQETQRSSAPSKFVPRSQRRQNK